MSNHEKKSLIKIKNNAFKLKTNGQIPYSLYIQIVNLNYDSDKSDVIYLRDLCEKYIRVGGFYIRHPEFSLDCDKEIESWLSFKK